MNPTPYSAALALLLAGLSGVPARAAAERAVLDRPIPAPRTSAAVSANVDRADVISATPVVRQVLVPQRNCVDQPVVMQRQPSGAGALLGAVAGAAVGNAIGGGSGRAAATALGLVGGAAIGNQVEAGGPDGAVTRLERRCSTQGVYEDRTIGYDVVYEYNGREFTTRMRSDPGAFVNVQVQATGGAEPLPVAPRSRSGQPVPFTQQGGESVVAAAPPPAYIEPVYETYPAYAPYYAPSPYYAPYYGSYYGPSYAPSWVPFGSGLALGAVIGFGGHSHGGWRGGHRR